MALLAANIFLQTHCERSCNIAGKKQRKKAINPVYLSTSTRLDNAIATNIGTIATMNYASRRTKTAVLVLFAGEYDCLHVVGDGHYIQRIGRNNGKSWKEYNQIRENLERNVI